MDIVRIISKSYQFYRNSFSKLNEMLSVECNTKTLRQYFEKVINYQNERLTSVLYCNAMKIISGG